jgi:hypothetical protein
MQERVRTSDLASILILAQFAVMSLRTFVEVMDAMRIHNVVNWIPSEPNEEGGSGGQRLPRMMAQRLDG